MSDLIYDNEQSHDGHQHDEKTGRAFVLTDAEPVFVVCFY
jgi:hypothetical protein